MNAAWLAQLRARADQPPQRPRVALRLAGAEGAETAGPVIGSVEPALAARLVAGGLPVATAPDGIVVQGAADAALARIARWLHEQGLASRWRDERLAVTDADGAVHAAIERAAARPLGITTFAVHLAGRDPAGRWWLQQRALDKATDPGLWDTLVGGLVAGGESLVQTLERETWEEAGLRLAELDGLREHGELLVRRPVAEGYMVERMTVYSAGVPADRRPENQDGEVQRFECVDEPTLRTRLAAEQFTLEAALAFVRVLGA